MQGCCGKLATVVAEAIVGLEFAEGAGLSDGDARTTDLASDILLRLKAALLLEVLTWFIGVGEVKAAIAGADLADRLAKLARALKVLGRVSHSGASAAGSLSRLDRMLRVLARLADLADDADAARLLELLPEGHLSAVERLAERIDMPEGATVEMLRAAIGADNALIQDAQGVGRALAIADRVERKAAAGGGMNARITSGLHHLIHLGPSDTRAIVRAVGAIDVQDIQLAMHAMTFVRPGHFARWGPETLAKLFESRRAMTALRDAGGDLVDALLLHGDDKLDNLESLLSAIDLHRSRVPEPAEFQRFP